MIEVGDTSDIVPGLVSLDERLEYEVITRLYKMTRVDELVVGMVTPRPAMNPFAGAQQGRFRALEQALRELYGTGLRAHVSLEEPLPDDVDVLLVAAPRELSERAVFHFEQYLLRGGRAILLLDPIHAGLDQPPPTEPESSGFEDWLVHLGVTMESGVVGDFARGARLSRPRFSRVGLSGLGPYPYWVAVTGGRLDQDNPAMQGFGVLPLFWPQAFSVDEEKQAASGREITVLGKTTEYGYRRPDLIGLDDGAQDAIQETDLEPFLPLMLLLEGKVESFWKGRDAPEAEAGGGPGGMPPGMMPGMGGMMPGMGGMMPPRDAEGDAPEDGTDDEPAGDEPADDEPADDEPANDEPAMDEPAADEPAAMEPAGEEAEEDTGPPKLDAGKALLVILSDAELIDDDAARLRGLGAEYTYGFAFVFNLIDWMGGSEELLSLRARTRTSRTIDVVEPNQQKLIKWGHFAVIPLLSLLIGIVVFIVRRYQR